MGQGIAELREQIRTDLKANVAAVSSSAAFEVYTDADTVNNDSLDFLCDFAGFSRTSSDEVRLNVTPISLNSGVGGSYSATIIIKKQIDYSGNVIEGNSPRPNEFEFPYKFIIESTGGITATTPSVEKSLRLIPGEEAGEFKVVVRRGNFARFALFTNHHSAPRKGQDKN